MTDFLRLPERVDGTTVDVTDLVARVEARDVVLDWDDVTEVDHDACRALFHPFEGRFEQFGDNLGIWSMPDRIQPDIDWAIGIGPDPGQTEAAWLLLQAGDSKYDDAEGRHYEYPGSIPNGRRVKEGDIVVCALPSRKAKDGRRVFGVGTIGSIEPGSENRLRAHFDEWVSIDPPLTFDELGGDPRPNATNSINRIPRAFVERVRATAESRPADEAPPVVLPTPCQMPELDLETPAGVRDALHRLVALDLLGPACGPEEELLDQPKTRYVVGTLAPKSGDTFDPIASDDSLGGAGEEGATEGTTEGQGVVSKTLFASSIGMTFTVAGGVDAVRLRVSWGAYDRVESDGWHVREDGTPRTVWKRKPRGGEPFEIPLQADAFGPVAPDPDVPEVIVRGVVREADGDGTKLVSVFLVNEQVVEPDEQLKDKKWIFQPEISVEAVDGESAVFERRDRATAFDPADADLEAEERALLSMVYRKNAEFAIGHGVAVHATPAGDPWVDDAGWERALSIRTTVLPWYDVPVTEAPSDDELAQEFPGFEGFELDMGKLADAPTAELVARLRRVPDTYGRWIDAQRARIGEGGAPDLESHREAALVALDRADEARQRLAEGVDVLEADADALEAFRFTNRAMRLQRLRSVFALARRRGKDITFADVEAQEPAQWRAFQLAFLLLNVPTVAKLDHPYRTSEMASYADLLWFPTGGGKTEAYLGVAAFAIAIRRFQGQVDGYEGDGGVTVIMRYTLRLLTLQQFQRASTLVCAMEFLRLNPHEGQEGQLGTEPFRIGLWVGAKSTPNTTAVANRWVNEHKGNSTWTGGAGSSSPLQLTNCPWCGEGLNPNHVRVESYKTGRGRTLLHCDDRECDFNRRNNPDEGIPVVTVDEEIYRLLPTFLLATVDKFAQMPWRGEVQALFGRVSAKCERHAWLGTDADCSGVHTARGSLPASVRVDAPPKGFRPPDLIIQDELHLISGPLGTLVGLYETAIDRLCSWQTGGNVVRPKVIASTATTRRAPEQVHRLFCRQVRVFPPSGLDAADNFFSRQRRPAQEIPGRRYMGVCAPGRSRPSVLIRVYVALLAAAEWLWANVADNQKHLVDPYMTLLGYFNSLRELGGMKRLVDDDVQTRAFRVERGDRPGMAQRKMFPESTVRELTSRVRSSDIPQILDQLDESFVQARAEGGAKGGAKARPLDAVLATNMVSVGVDVQRLGLMVVSGQPKATAEYIQASSRVGRSVDRPGLVVTVLNWSRPRDLSHYEQFEQYHAVFYRYVEALTVTPFAARALDRGLTGVVGSLVRIEGLDLNHNHGAGEVKGAGDFASLIEAIADRAQNTSDAGAEGAQLGQFVRQAVAAKLDDWGAEALVPNRKLGYKAPRNKDGVTVALLNPPGTGPWGPFTVPTSMREVEPGVGLIYETGRTHTLPDWSFQSPAAKGDAS
jgi:hypothetical protein